MDEKENKGADFTSRYPSNHGEDLNEAEINLAHLSQNQEAQNAVVQARPGRALVAGIRQPPTPQELEQALLMEQATLGIAMSHISALTSDLQVITYDRINSASSSDMLMSSLVSLIRLGCPENKSAWPKELLAFHQYRDHLTNLDSTVLYKGRTVIPASLRAEVLDTLHSGHQGISAMNSVAAESVFWPGMSEAIIRRRLACNSCDRVTPSQPSSPPWPLPQPAFPFERVCTDYFSFAGKSYFIIVDRYSGWLSVYKAGKDGAKGFISTMKEYFSTFGISQEVTSDEGSQYTSNVTQKFFRDWGIHHRLSSAYYPHSNQRSEQGVKSAKRMLRENIAADGTLNTDKFLRALLMHRNTPDRDTGLSPAQVIFGKAVRDFFPIKPGNLQLHPEWRITFDQREKALARRHARREKDLSEHTKLLAPLTVGQVVLVQNQSGNTPLRWDKSGQVVEVLPYDQYRIKMDGTGRSSLRNRKFLRAITPFSHTTRCFKDTSQTDPDMNITPPISANDEDNTQITSVDPLPVENDTVMNNDPSPSNTRSSTRIRKIPVHLQDFNLNRFSLVNNFSLLKELTGEEA